MEYDSTRSKIQCLNSAEITSTGMALRVIGALATRMEQRRTRRFQFSTFILAILLVFSFGISMITLTEGDMHRAELNSRYVVNIDLVTAGERDFEVMEIQLSSGLHLFSQHYPELSLVDKVVLDRSSLVGTKSLPVIVQGGERGTEILNVQFFDRNHKLVDSRPFKIEFY